MPQAGERVSGGQVRIAVAHDEATAERWAAALEAAGIDVGLRIEDGTYLNPLGSTFGGQTFVYPLLVPAAERAEAAAVLVELGAQGPFYRSGRDGRAVRGALAVAALAVLMAIGFALRGA